MLQLDSNSIAINLRKKMGLRHFPYHTIFSLIIGLHLGRHLGYIEMLNDVRVASLGFFKDSICTVIAPGPQTVGSIAVYGSTTQLLI